MLRVMRNHRRAAYGERTGYEKVATAAGADRRRRLPRPDAGRAREAAPGTARIKLGEEHGYRNAQATVIAPDRHDRSGDGLRHHRHRAGLCAGEVQEARRRRLFQDHQPRRPRSLARARLQRGRDRRDRGLCRRSRQPGAGPGHQPHHPEGQGLHQGRHRHRRKGVADRVRHQVRVQQMDARRSLPARRARRFAGRPRRADLRSACAYGLHQARDRGRQHPCLRRDDGGRRAASEARALCRCSTAPIRAAAPASAISRSRAISA